VPFRSTTIDVLFVNWRDADHPEGGGSEQYVHRVAEGLAEAGLQVTLFCAAHDRAPADEVRAGVRIVRRGGRMTVYPRALAFVRRHRPRLVVDVQNGLPFGSPLVTRAPVVVLVHHVHREQWPIVFGRLGGAVGWWVESVLAPRIYRRSRYVTVSSATATELAGLGVAAERITVVPNGIAPAPDVRVDRDPRPRLVVLGRLVPHKRVEHALEVLARLRPRWPDLRLSVVGEGWWDAKLRAAAERLGVAGSVDFLGHVDEQTKHEELARAWVHLCPSVKEGWGLVVSEAGQHEVPTVGYRSAGGLRESVVDGRTGLLVDDVRGMVEAVDRLLRGEQERRRLGRAAAAHAARFSWPATVRSFTGVLARAAAGTPSSAVALAVVQHVDRRRVRLLDNTVVGVGDALHADHGHHADRAAGAERDERSDEGLHVPAFRGGRRRSGTVDAPTMIHNTAAATSPSATP
jgi:glycosyltransferase involved in cell wall biosynthesis